MSHAPHAHVLFRVGADLVDGEVGAAALVVGAEPEAEQHVDDAVDDEAGERTEGRAHQAADQLRGEGDAAQAAERLQAEDAAGDAAPQPAQSVQGPHAQHVVELPLGLLASWNT